MKFKELVILVETAKSPVAEPILHMVSSHGFYVEDYSDIEREVQAIAPIDLIESHLRQKDKSICTYHLYMDKEASGEDILAYLDQRFQAEGVSYSYRWEECEDNTYLYNYRKYFNPIKIGKRLYICPSWKSSSRSGDRVIVKVDPGLTFGTGKHETTRMCLEALDRNVKEGIEVLDIGCGSGILSIAAIKLGAQSAVGVDIDELAIKASYENAESNSVKKNFTGIQGHQLENVKGTYDLIVANIVADVLITLTPHVRAHCKKDAVYILSGIIDERAQEVREALMKDFQIIREQSLSGWVLMEARLSPTIEKTLHSTPIMERTDQQT